METREQMLERHRKELASLDPFAWVHNKARDEFVKGLIVYLLWLNDGNGGDYVQVRKERIMTALDKMDDQYPYRERFIQYIASMRPAYGWCWDGCARAVRKTTGIAPTEIEWDQIARRNRT